MNGGVLDAIGPHFVSAGEDLFCHQELRTQVILVFMIEMSMNVCEILLPILMPKLVKFVVLRVPPPEQIHFDIETGRCTIGHIIQREVDKAPYQSSFCTSEVDGTFNEYLEVSILFGYITLFSSVFPLAPVIGAFMFLLEMRVDGFKLYDLVRRPLPRDSNGIGSWLTIFKVTAWIGVVTNAILLVCTFGTFDGPSFDFLEKEGRRIYVFAFLILFLCGLKTIISMMMPEMPDKVKFLDLHNAFVITQITEMDDCLTHRHVAFEDIDQSVWGAKDGPRYYTQEFGVSCHRNSRRIDRLKRQAHFLGRSMTVGLEDDVHPDDGVHA